MHTNQEDVKQCLYCGEKRPSRGLTPHVRMTKGGGHGPRGEVPEDFNFDEHPIVGKTEVEIKEFTRRADHDRWICHDCGRVFKGKSGLGIHYGKKHTGEIQLHEHTRIPAVGKFLIVPSHEYIDLIKLTPQERRDGWEVTVNPVMDFAGDAMGNIMSGEEALETLRSAVSEYADTHPDGDNVLSAFQVLHEEISLKA